MIIKLYVTILLLLVLVDLTIALIERDNETFSRVSLYAILYSPLVMLAMGWI